MFDVHCHQHGGRVLLGPRCIESLENTAGGMVLRWRCYCGATGTRHFGRRAALTPAA
jgi:hypothetical protein